MNIEKLQKLFEQSTDKYGDAKKMGTSYQSLYNIIYKGSVCKVDLLQKIANFYNVPVGYFFDEEELPSSKQTIDKNLELENIKLKAQVDLLRDQVRELSGLKESGKAV